MMRHSHRKQFAVAVCVGVIAVAAQSAEPTPARQRELANLLLQDCGSCHGLELTGGLGPPLTREALAGKSADMLRAVILDGRPGTPMPPWRPLLSQEDVDWLVQQLLTREVSYAAH